MNNTIKPFILVSALTPQLLGAQPSDHLVFEGNSGPGKGKHVVFLSGDEEYRSEESMPMMAQLMAELGFKCSVLFSLNNKGIVDPNNQKSLSHSEALDSADAIVMCVRFRNWEDQAMQRFDQAFERGTPIVALRTSTHAFKFPKTSKWAKYSFNAKPETGWDKGFGRQVLGETWVNHHGVHKKEGTRSVIEEANKNHPILQGVGTIFGTSDVYGASPLKPSTILLRGEVTKTLEADSPAVEGKKNKPMQPIAWTREFKQANGKTNKILTTTMGAATDLSDANLRRLVVNGVFWGMDMNVPKDISVDTPGEYKPSKYSFNAFKKGLKPSDFVLSPATPSKKTEAKTESNNIRIKQNEHITLLGSGLGSRMNHFGHFETDLQLRFPNNKLIIRNLCDEGNTPGFRPHPGRPSPWAFPGAEKFQTELKKGSGSQGRFESPDQWLTRLKTDTIIAFFGFNSSFNGPAGLDSFREELDGFIKHTLAQKYNGKERPQLVLVSPTAVQDLSSTHGTPDGKSINANLKLYTEAMQEVATANKIPFVDVFSPSLAIFSRSTKPLTVDGALLNDRAYRWLAQRLSTSLFGKTHTDTTHKALVHDAVMEKNWCWMKDYKIANGVHVYGRRYKPFGPQNYPDELIKTREMTKLRDHAIWRALEGKKSDLAKADAKTHPLPEVPSNYKPSNKNGSPEYLPGSKSETKIEVADGYKIELFASEREFTDLANPVQISFDNKGRLWVATMPSYPHYKIGDPKPSDKLIIFEDTNGDGKADKQTTFADDLHIPIGFEITDHGVYVSQSDSLVLLKDTDGDDRYDTKEIVLSGFDDHDTHHAISAFCADPSGAIVMGEGVFLHSNVETIYGPQRGTNGGFFRYSPQRKKLIRYAQYSIPNPWGIAYDSYGQDFFIHTSGPSASWMLPGTVKPRYGVNLKAPDVLTSNKVRPTSGLEIVSSSHFPDNVQGDILINNNIGYLGAKQHQVVENGTGFSTKYRQDLFKSADKNFRPVDLEFAPDGSLYIADWHNALIGHMQHNARDPFRDHAHGRIYRLTYPSRPLVKPASVDGASISTLLDNLTLPEYRTRYRTRRELRGRDADDVLPALKAWAAAQTNERHKLEALWVSWGLNQVDEALLKQLLKSQDHKIRSAAVRVLRFNEHLIEDQASLLMVAANDDHGRVRLEAIAAASWIGKEQGLPIVEAAGNKAVDKYIKQSLTTSKAHLQGESSASEKKHVVKTHLKGKAKQLYLKGAEIYEREGHCGTCHQADGKGLPASGFPPLSKTKWAIGSEDRLIKLTLKGLHGPIEVLGKPYPGQVPMTPFEGMLNDEEIASVLTYVRNSFGNKASAITPQKVQAIRAEVKGKQGFYNPDELLKEHPHQ
ncbi:PVC-type heme-binding CxxCH protein [Oceaniferula marina]|nr:PVC-type heme-binding CxxCH protein [Oceaniferula marina]